MKKSSLILSTAAIVFIFASCKKEECHECHYDKNGSEIELGKKCGDDLKNIEASGFTDSGTVYEVHCHEH